MKTVKKGGSVTKINSGKTLPGNKLKNPLEGLKLPQIHRSPDWDPDLEEKSKTIYDRSVIVRRNKIFQHVIRNVLHYQVILIHPHVVLLEMMELDGYQKKKV